jgi:hypothetical protein
MIMISIISFSGAGEKQSASVNYRKLLCMMPQPHIYTTALFEKF